ncbi:MAG: MBL fold metallo-hydrolase [Clostridia bacterium]|nr:MBL fold metallo-hydrolase [Clostridia bacterium]
MNETKEIKQTKQWSIVSLYSGSKGNAIFVRVGKDAILIDAGKSARALCTALREIGSDISEIGAIFVTHDHHDHTSALEIIAKYHEIPIHMTGESAVIFDRTPDAPIHARLVRHDPSFCVTVGELTVRSFRTSHDSRMSVGYRIEFFDGERPCAIGVATDLGYVSNEVREGLLGCDAVVLESNHDLEMLQNGSYPYDLKKRIASRYGHLSNTDSAAFCSELSEGGTKAILLAHLSEENNEPMLALNEALCAVGNDGVCVCVAAPDCPTKLG